MAFPLTGENRFSNQNKISPAINLVSKFQVVDVCKYCMMYDVRFLRLVVYYT
jgi:hypothetical protein